MKLVVHAPATTANLGSGFDTLGMALDIWNVYRVERSNRKEYLVEGKYAKILELTDPDLFFFEKLENISKKLGVNIPNLRVKVNVGVPPGKGLGSSATVALTVVEVMEKFARLKLNMKEKIKLLVDMEGHPDNVIPALFGGLMIVAMESESKEFFYQRIPFPKDWKVVIFVPDFTVSTKMAREILPKYYKRETLVSQIRRIAFLVSGFYEKSEKAVRFGMEDFVHQNYRLKMEDRIKRIYDFVETLNPISVFLSGSGPSIGALFRKNDEIPKVNFVEKLETRISNGMKVSVGESYEFHE